MIHPRELIEQERTVSLLPALAHVRGVERLSISTIGSDRRAPRSPPQPH